MTNYGARELYSDPNNEENRLSDELGQKFDALIYKTGDILDAFVTPDNLQVDITDIRFGRFNDGTMSVGRTSSEKGHDEFIEFKHSEDPGQNFTARSASRLNAPGWSVNSNKRWSNRDLLDHIETQWPINDDSADHREAYKLSKDIEAANALTPQQIIELVERYTVLQGTGSKSLIAHWDYEGTIHDGTHKSIISHENQYNGEPYTNDLGGSKKVFSTFRLDKSDRQMGMPRSRFEITLPIEVSGTTTSLTYVIERNEVGSISMYAEFTSPVSGKTSRLEVQDPEAVYEYLEEIAENMLDDKVPEDLQL